MYLKVVRLLFELIHLEVRDFISLGWFGLIVRVAYLCAFAEVFLGV